MLMRIRSLLASLVLLGWPLVAHPARAAAGGDYQPYSPGDAAEQVSAPLFVVLAYSAIWIVLLLFVVSLWRRQRRVETEMEQLRQQLGGR
jgi:CcmD family protein